MAFNRATSDRRELVSTSTLKWFGNGQRTAAPTPDDPFELRNAYGVISGVARNPAWVASSWARADVATAPTSFRFDFRDRKPGATVRVTGRAAIVDWQGKHHVKLSGEKAVVQFDWHAEPVVGAPASFDFRFGPGFPSTWKIRSEEGAPAVHYWERLPVQEALPHLMGLGSQHGLQSALLESMLTKSTHWRFHLAEPL